MLILLILLLGYSPQVLAQNITIDYVGCFAYMTGFSYGGFCRNVFQPGTKMSNAICSEFCAIYLYKYSVSFSGQSCCCYNQINEINSGENEDVFVAVNETYCRSPCTLNRNETCGGSNLNEINIFGSDTSNYGESLGCKIITDTVYNAELTYAPCISNVTIDTCVECCNSFSFSAAVVARGSLRYSNSSCFCTNDSNIDSLIEVSSNQTCGMPCTYNKTQYCGGSSYIGSIYRILYETKENEYYVEWQGAYKTISSGVRNLFVSVTYEVTKMYSMVELMRICSIYGYSLGYQMNPYYDLARLILCINVTNLRDPAIDIKRTNHPIDLSYIDFDEYIPEIYKLNEFPKSLKMNLNPKLPVKYAGCYTNTFADVIYTPVSDLTFQLCNQFCGSLNYTYSGTRQRNCFCGSQLIGSKIDESQCNYTCENSEEICGGSSSLSVYKNNLYTNSPFYTIVPNTDVINEENNILSTSFVSNRLLCGNLCNQNLQCKSFLFKTDQNCTLLTKIPDTDNYLQSSSSNLFIRDW